MFKFWGLLIVAIILVLALSIVGLRFDNHIMSCGCGKPPRGCGQTMPCGG